ncbi:MAG: hypothetical protein CSA09_03775 [Candidatus Contendobacter odensis]|uniref:Transcriptional regulator n=1 Tax=Candidatus Contendibacter odensensis TaxID=1400860 RepID=A0A2G6PEN7_9GAMM|nr:MAG: hypothetical protein CSA09_03775 [Candidatus Contendobacter odensis]
MNRALLPYTILAFAILCLPSASHSQSTTEDAKKWLQRMVRATQTLNYEGTFVYVQGAHIEAMHIVHSGGGGGKGERQRLMSLNGALREILVANNSVICLSPKRQAGFAGTRYQRAPFPLSIRTDLKRLEQHYRLRMLGRDRVAGLETRIIAIEPKDHWRYGYRLWLDQQSGMILRSALLDQQGEAVEHLMFTDVKLKSPIDELAFQLPALPEREHASDTDSADSASSGDTMQVLTDEPITQSLWQVPHMPEGFVKLLHNRIVRANDPHPTEHMVFADGLATISIFLEKLKDGKAAPLLQGKSRLGLMSAYGLLVEGYQVLVVGEVPVATVQFIATSIRRDSGELAND